MPTLDRKSIWDMVLKLFGVKKDYNQKETIKPITAQHSKLYQNNINLTDELIRDFSRNDAWYSGDTKRLLFHYQEVENNGMSSNYQANVNQHFYQNSDDDVLKIHTGLPQQISETWASVLGDQPLEITLGKMFDNEANQKKLKDINSANKTAMPFKILEAFEKTSAHGHVVFKLSAHSEVTNSPTVEVKLPNEYKILEKYGHIVGYVFEKIIPQGDVNYSLVEIYGPGYIQMQVYKRKNQELLPVQFGEVRELYWIKELVPQELKEMVLNETVIWFELPTNEIMAEYLPNKLPNKRFSNSNLGSSDYEGAYDIYSAQDESFSSMINDLRIGRGKVFIDETLLNWGTNGAARYNVFKSMMVKLAGDDSQDPDKKFESVQFNLRTAEHEMTAMSLERRAVNKAGLSMATFMANLDQGNAEAKRESEKLTLRTRNKKIQTMTPALESLYKKLLILHDIMNMKEPQEYELTVSFYDYGSPTFEDRLGSASTAKTAGVMSNEFIVDMLHPELDEDAKNAEINRLNVMDGVETDLDPNDDTGENDEVTEAINTDNPLPNPNEGESEEDFVKRAMPLIREEHPEFSNEQVQAVAHGRYRK